MDIKEEVKQDIWTILQIYITAKDNFLYSKYLFLPDTPEERIYINSSMHFKLIRLYLWQTCIIETSKLFSTRKGDKFRLSHFIQKCKNDGHYGPLKLDPEKVAKWEGFLEDNKKVIDDIMTLRDKVYAHRDRDIDDLKIGVSFMQVQTLLTLAEEIIREIYLTVFESGIHLATPGFESGKFDIIKILYDSREASLKPMVDLYNELEGK